LSSEYGPTITKSKIFSLSVVNSEVFYGWKNETLDRW
jgi:hypothetical protein